MESKILVMQSLVKKAKEHLKQNNMTYSEHFVFATKYSIVCIKASFFLLIHSIAPCFYAHAGSRLVRKMEKDFTEHFDGEKNG